MTESWELPTEFDFRAPLRRGFLLVQLGLLLARTISSDTFTTSPIQPKLWGAGEPEFETRRRNQADGIPLNEVTLADIAVSAQELGVDTAGYEWLPA